MTSICGTALSSSYTVNANEIATEAVNGVLFSVADSKLATWLRSSSMSASPKFTVVSIQGCL